VCHRQSDGDIRRGIKKVFLVYCSLCIFSFYFDCIRGGIYGKGCAWLEEGAEINYAAQDNDILTAIGFRPDADSRVDYQEKFTPAQNLIYARRKAGLAAREPV